MAYERPLPSGYVVSDDLSRFDFAAVEGRGEGVEYPITPQGDSR